MYKIYFSTEIVYINLFSSRKYLDIIFQLYHLGTFHVVGNTNSLGCVLKPKAVERAFKIREYGLCVHSSGRTSYWRIGIYNHRNNKQNDVEKTNLKQSAEA